MSSNGHWYATCDSATVVLQAVADARSAEQMQVDWLKSEMAPHFTQKLLRCTRDILKWIGAHDSDSKHQFPTLAGSHLQEVLTCVRATCSVCQSSLSSVWQLVV